MSPDTDLFSTKWSGSAIVCRHLKLGGRSKTSQHPVLLNYGKLPIFKAHVLASVRRNISLKAHFSLLQELLILSPFLYK